MIRRTVRFSLSSVPLQLPELQVGPLSTHVALAVKQLPLRGTKFPQIVKYWVPSAVARALSKPCVVSSGMGTAVLVQPASDRPVSGELGLPKRSRAALPSVRSELVRKSKAYWVPLLNS